MPLYDFKCEKCGHVDEMFKKYQNSSEPDVCTVCGGESRKQLSAPAMSYEGGKSVAQRVPDGFKDVLRRVRDEYPGAKGMKSSVL